MIKTEIKERPILFSGPMVKAILEGRKTQTRRVIKLCKKHSNKLCRPSGRVHYSIDITDDGLIWYPYAGSGPKPLPLEQVYKYCPFGQPGDRLWVRETWNTTFDGTPVYKAGKDHDWAFGWKPSIHMPRWASRITLEVTGIRLERLQDISEEDARAEGCEVGPNGRVYPSKKAAMVTTYKAGFQTLWKSINGPGSWDANPWVWVVEFQKV